MPIYGILERYFALVVLMIVVLVVDHRVFQKIKVRPWLRGLVMSVELAVLLALGAFWVVKSETLFGLAIVFLPSAWLYVCAYIYFRRKERDELADSEQAFPTEGSSSPPTQQPPTHET